MNKRELAELALDLGLDFDKESGIIYGRRRDYAFYLETITDGDEFAIFFSVRCEQGYIGRDTLEALINDSEVLIDFERAGYSLACQILANQESPDNPQEIMYFLRTLMRKGEFCHLIL